MSARLVLAVLALSCLPLAASAAEKEDNARADDGNRYAVGRIVELTEGVAGDYVAAGGQTSINRDVRGDLTVLGGAVWVTSRVRGDARIFGGSVRITGSVGGDLFVVAGSVVVDPTAEIGGDLRLHASNVTVLGTVRGDAALNAATADLGGEVFGTLDAAAGDLHVSGTIHGPATVAARALATRNGAFLAPVTYWTESASPPRGLPKGSRADPELREAATASMLPLWLRAAGSVIGTASVLFGLVLVALFCIVRPRLFAGAAKRVTAGGTSCFFSGLALAAAVPAVAALLCLTVIGLPLGLLLFALYLFLFSVAPAVAAVVLAHAAGQASGLAMVLWTRLSLSAAVLLALLWIGSMGQILWLAKTAALLVGLGALLQELRHTYRRRTVRA